MIRSGTGLSSANLAMAFAVSHSGVMSDLRPICRHRTAGAHQQNLAGRRLPARLPEPTAEGYDSTWSEKVNLNPCFPGRRHSEVGRGLTR